MAGAEAATSTVDERGSSTYRPDQADRLFQEPQWPKPRFKPPVDGGPPLDQSQTLLVLNLA